MQNWSIGTISELFRGLHILPFYRLMKYKRVIFMYKVCIYLLLWIDKIQKSDIYVQKILCPKFAYASFLLIDKIQNSDTNVQCLLCTKSVYTSFL